MGACCLPHSQLFHVSDGSADGSRGLDSSPSGLGGRLEGARRRSVRSLESQCGILTHYELSLQYCHSSIDPIFSRGNFGNLSLPISCEPGRHGAPSSLGRHSIYARVIILSASMDNANYWRASRTLMSDTNFIRSVVSSLVVNWLLSVRQSCHLVESLSLTKNSPLTALLGGRRGSHLEIGAATVVCQQVLEAGVRPLQTLQVANISTSKIVHVSRTNRDDDTSRSCSGGRILP